MAFLPRSARGLPMPEVWTPEQISEDVRASREAFVTRRLAEIARPDSPYRLAYRQALSASSLVIAKLSQLLAQPADRQLLLSVFKDADQWTALRYLAGPPISEDDFDSMLGTRLTQSAIRDNQQVAEEVSRWLAKSLDSHRFPWVLEDRAPSAGELLSAQVSTAVVMAHQKTQTGRRSDEKNALEGSICDVLIAMGYQRRPAVTRIQTAHDTPGPFEFMSACNIGDHNADFVIGLHDGRMLAVECKASNSAINSRKRLNKETERDADHWRQLFGQQVVPAAALRGVFDPGLVLAAQSAGLSIFWEHTLGGMAKFIASTGP